MFLAITQSFLRDVTTDRIIRSDDIARIFSRSNEDIGVSYLAQHQMCRAMTFSIAQFEFEGPGLTPGDLKDEAGVFLLLHLIDDGSYELLDFGQFERLKTSWTSVDFDYFLTAYPGQVSLAAHYCSGSTGPCRRAIVKVIRKEYEETSATAERQMAVVSGQAS